MTNDVSSLPSRGLNLRSLEQILSQSKYQGFPIIEDRASRNLIGYIGRTELRYALDRAKKEGFISPNAKCYFTQPDPATVQTPSAATPSVTFEAIESSAGQQTIDFSRFIDPTPLAVHPRLPLETVMELFKKMGPRVIIVEYRGRLTGLVTVKDCLKFQFKVEAQDTAHDGLRHDIRQEKLWNMIKISAKWVAEKIGRLSGGKIQLKGTNRGPGLLASEAMDPRDQLSPIRASSDYAILDGTEDDDGAVELQGR